MNSAGSAVFATWAWAYGMLLSNIWTYTDIHHTWECMIQSRTCKSGHKSAFLYFDTCAFYLHTVLQYGAYHVSIVAVQQHRGMMGRGHK